jgi:hypothetical protein
LREGYWSITIYSINRLSLQKGFLGLCFFPLITSIHNKLIMLSSILKE